MKKIEPIEIKDVVLERPQTEANYLKNGKAIYNAGFVATFPAKELDIVFGDQKLLVLYGKEQCQIMDRPHSYHLGDNWVKVEFIVPFKKNIQFYVI